MNQLFSRPDWYCAPCGNLRAAVTEQAIPGMPAFMGGLRVMFAADFHVLDRTTDGEIAALVDLMASRQPDLLLLGGDYGDTAPLAERLFAALGRLCPPLGAYGVIGNNDAEAWQGRLRDLRRVMARAGCRLLVNQSARLAVNGGTLFIGGVDEGLYGRPDASGLYPERPAPDACRILLSHYARVPENPPELMLSGHTHGGQFNLLGVTPFTIGFERLFHSRHTHRRVASQVIAGLRETGGTKLLVTKGIGASRIQWRVGVRPEINLLRFEP
ncbi:MAG: metallophosphoesterase [Clostridia bacterium]|nr:metallophosphoesterase [Clostridia bacterium]